MVTLSAAGAEVTAEVTEEEAVVVTVVSVGNGTVSLSLLLVSVVVDVTGTVVAAAVPEGAVVTGSDKTEIGRGYISSILSLPPVER